MVAAGLFRGEEISDRRVDRGMRLRNNGFSDGLDILVLGLLTALRKDSALWSFQVGHQLEELDIASAAATSEAMTVPS